MTLNGLRSVSKMSPQMIHKIDFSGNLNPLEMPDGILRKVKLKSLIKTYPDYKNIKATDAISRYYGIPVENIAVGVGSTEFFFAIPRALNFERGIVTSPTFWEYEFSLNTTGKRVQFLERKEEEGFSINKNALRNIISTRDAVYLCNPNNPTSTLTRQEDIEEICSEFPKTTFVVDETYLLFRRDYERLSLMREATKRKNLVVVTSLSKFFSIPGARIGICSSSEENINAIKKQQIPYGVNPISQAIIPLLFEEEAYIRESRRFMEDERKRVYDIARGNPHLKLNEPQASFILLKVDDRNIYEYLNKRGIFVRSGREFPHLGKNYLRAAIRKSDENDRLFATINDYFNSSPS